MSLNWGEAGLIPVSSHTLSELQGTPYYRLLQHYPV